MLLWISLAILIAGIALIYIDANDICLKYSAAISVLSIVFTIVGLFAFGISAGVAIMNRVSPDAERARYMQTYDALTYQYENGFYDNENGIGKKELLDDIIQYNNDVLSGRENKDSVWIGIFFPDIYDDIPLINIKGE